MYFFLSYHYVTFILALRFTLAKSLRDLRYHKLMGVFNVDTGKCTTYDDIMINKITSKVTIVAN